MQANFKYLVYLIFPVLFSCKKDIGSVNYGDYPVAIGRIMAKNCATSGCHNNKSYQAASNYNLETWTSMFSGSSSGSPVIPYSSKFSSLCYYVNTFPELGSQNSPTMPQNKAPLSYNEVKLIKDWVDGGAPDINGNVMWASNPLRKKLYAVNQGCDVVTVFDSQTQLPMRYIPVGNKSSGNTPHHLKVSPDGKYWYVIFINNNIMQKFRCSDDSYIGDIPLSPLAAGTGTSNAQDWNTFVISKDSKRAYCVSWTASGKVAAVDLENMKLIHFLGGQYYPHGIVLNPSNDAIYVAAQTGNFITKIDTGFTSTTPISLENSPTLNYNSSLDPHDLALSPNNLELYITCQKSNEVRVFNMALGLVTATVSTGKYPQEIVYSTAGSGSYYITCTYDSTTFPNSMGVVTKIDAASLVATNLKVGYQPHGIAVDDTKKLLYVTSRNLQSNGPTPHHTSQCLGRNGFVNFVDLNSFTILSKRYELSVDPYFIYTRP
ncbi:MAG: YncE family protein [Bacteroidota bacterium]